MGLLDVLNGMQNGPRGPSDPEAKGGMSPITMAILGLLAYKAYKHIAGGSSEQPDTSPASPGGGAAAPGDTSNASLPGGLGGALGGLLGGNSAGGGGLGDLLKGGLGGLLAGGAAGSILSGGLGDLLKQFEQSGHSEAADSWVKPGPNKQISPDDLASALGADQISALSSQTGLSRDELLSGLAQHLPEVVNHLTPDGRMPTENEIASRL
jgi:uncharacterized protein YidB (DUF937 family)